MASYQRQGKNITPRTSNQTSTRNASQSTKKRSLSFNIRGDLMLPEVIILQKDITELSVNVIVCPVSPTLKTTSGISKVVMDKAGSGLNRKFVEKQKQGILSIGHAFVTNSFNLLNCRHIIHVVVPKMPPENENPGACFRDLEKAFYNCFEELWNVQVRSPAGKGRVETLAIPALGAGTNKIPKEMVAEVMCDAVHKFLAGKKSLLAPHLRKIFLVSLDHEMLSLLRKEWDTVSGQKSSRDPKFAQSYDKGSSKYSSQAEPVGAGVGLNRRLHRHGSLYTSGSRWYDAHPSSDKGDRGSDKSDSQVELVGARGGVRHDSYDHSHGIDSSYKSSVWYDSPNFGDRSDVAGGMNLRLHLPDELVGRGVSSGDRGDINYRLHDKTDQSKVRDCLRPTNGGTPHDTDSDSDSKQGAWGGAHGPKCRKDYHPPGHMDRPQERDFIRAAAGRAPGKTDSDSDSGNDVRGSDYRSRGGINRGLPSSQSGFGSVTVARNYVTTSKKVEQSDMRNPGTGLRGRSDLSDNFFDEVTEATLDRAKALTVKESESCPICFDPIVGKNSESLPMCGHKVCRDCWKELRLHNPVCPVCRRVYGELRGDQPERAKMTFKTDPRIHLPGYERFGTIVIDYVVPDGKQTADHPNPGKPYRGTQRRAYLPNTTEGNEVLRLLEKAFKARLVFTIGRSVTSGTEDVVTWNDIHHKTNISGAEFGYPDPTYLTRVKEELAAKGIK